MDAIGSAKLAERIPADRAVTTTISRNAVVDAVSDDEPPELLLDVERLDAAGEVESGRISITWSRDELERLLELGTSEQLHLTFDGDELADAFADVEAHGLRARAAAISVAVVAGAAAGGGVAAAMPLGPEDAAATPASGLSFTDVSSGGGYTAPAAGSADARVTDVSSGGGYAAPAATTAADRVTDVSSGGYPPAVPAPADSGGSAFDVPAPAAGGIAGALALTIAAAAFATRRRGSTPRPA